MINVDALQSHALTLNGVVQRAAELFEPDGRVARMYERMYGCRPLHIGAFHSYVVLDAFFIAQNLTRILSDECEHGGALRQRVLLRFLDPQIEMIDEVLGDALPPMMNILDRLEARFQVADVLSALDEHDAITAECQTLRSEIVDLYATLLQAIQPAKNDWRTVLLPFLYRCNILSGSSLYRYCIDLYASRHIYL